MFKQSSKRQREEHKRPGKAKKVKLSQEGDEKIQRSIRELVTDELNAN